MTGGNPQVAERMYFDEIVEEDGAESLRFFLHHQPKGDSIGTAEAPWALYEHFDEEMLGEESQDWLDVNVVYTLERINGVVEGARPPEMAAAAPTPRTSASKGLRRWLRWWRR